MHTTLFTTSMLWCKVSNFTTSSLEP